MKNCGNAEINLRNGRGKLSTGLDPPASRIRAGATSSRDKGLASKSQRKGGRRGSASRNPKKVANPKRIGINGRTPRKNNGGKSRKQRIRDAWLQRGK